MSRAAGGKGARWWSRAATSPTARRTGSVTSGAPPPRPLHVVERFTRVDAETIDYEATITDPVRFAQPWTIRFALSTDQSGRGVTPGPLFEYACHEGNYALVNVLRGARVEDANVAAR